MMKANSRRGISVLDAPEESFARDQEWAGREPAPAGALQRKASAFDSFDDISPVERDEPAYKPRLGSMRVRMGAKVPKSTLGRVVAGTFAALLLGAVAVAGATLYSFVMHDEQFVVAASSQIQTEGNVHLTRAQLLSVFGEDVERNIFKVPLSQRRAALERLPWVSQATVMRLLPNRLRVSVVERTPVAFVRQGSHIGLVDASGVLLDMPEDAPGNPQYSFPVLTGLSSDDPLSTRAARMEVYRRFLKELDGSGQKISDSLSEVDVSSPEDVKALIPSGGADILVHFGDENFLQRYHHFEDHLPEWKQQYPKLASADMRYERQVVLEMQAGTGVPVSTESAALASATRNDAAVIPMSTKSIAKPVATTVKAKPKLIAKPVSAANAKMYAALAAARKTQTTGEPGQQ